MKKVVKVKVIKPKTKIVGEVKKGEGDKEIEELTEGEIPVGIGASSPFRLSWETQRTAGTVQGQPIPRQNVPRAETPNKPLYDVGKSMGGTTGKSTYNPQGAVGTPLVRRIGGGSAVNQGGVYPEPNRIEGGLRESVSDRSYSTQAGAGVGKSKGKKYAWDV